MSYFAARHVKVMGNMRKIIGFLPVGIKGNYIFEMGWLDTSKDWFNDCKAVLQTIFLFWKKPLFLACI